jgi:DNA-binding SARP family transcriptional activator/TolB-like protein
MLRLTTLGATDLRDRHGRAIRDVLKQPKRAALLVYLAVEGRKAPISRDRLVALFWPESDTARARNTLSQSLHHLRQAMGADFLESVGTTAVQVRGDSLWCDATVFADALERGEAELALDLYRGEFCPTLFVSGSPGVEEWIEEQRARLRRHALAASRTLAERLAAHGDASGALRVARRMLALRPDDEPDVRAMLVLLERLGDASGALTAYQEFAKRLKSDLDVEPAPETKQLVETMRRRRESPPTAAAGLPPSTPPGLPRSFTPARTRTREIVAASLTALVLVTAGLVARSVRERRDAPVRPGTIAVFPFRVRGGPRHAYLGEGLVDLLSVKLDGVQGIQAVDPASVLSAVRAGAGAPDAIARSLGAGRYLTGDLVESGGRLQVTASLYDVGGGRAIASADVTGDSASLFDLVDGLAARLLSDLVPGRDTGLIHLAAVSTASLPALKAYLAGERAMRAGRDAEAASAFQDAATLDTTFALAQYRLAVMSTWALTPQTFVLGDWMAAAGRNAQRLTPVVRDLLAGYAAYNHAYANEAERIYRRVATTHPDNVEAWFMLGETWFHYNPYRGRRMHESEAAFRRVLALDPSNAHALLHLARLAALEGRSAQLDSLGRVFMAAYPRADRTLEMRALIAFTGTDTAAVTAIVHEADTLGDLAVASLLSSGVAYAENLDASARLKPALLRPSREQRVLVALRWMLGDLTLTGGRWEDPSDPPASASDSAWHTESMALLAAAALIPTDAARIAVIQDRLRARRTWPVLTTTRVRGDSIFGNTMRRYLLALLALRAGDTAAARGEHEVLAREGVADRDTRQLAFALEAALAQARGADAVAAAVLDSFQLDPLGGVRRGSLHWGTLERFTHAEALRRLGRDEEAIALYDSFHGGYDVVFSAPAHLRLAQIYERQGRNDDARHHYLRFVSLWRHCDPAFRPLLDSARAALARLDSGRPTT